MGLIYKNFDGVPMIGVSTGDRFERAAVDSDRWELPEYEAPDEPAASDLCTLMSELEANLRGKLTDTTMFAAAPPFDVFERILSHTARACAQEDGLTVRDLAARHIRKDSIVVDFYRRLRRDWRAATIEEGLDVACPSRRVFVHAVIAELARIRSGNVARR